MLTLQVCSNLSSPFLLLSNPIYSDTRGREGIRSAQRQHETILPERKGNNREGREYRMAGSPIGE